MREYEYVSVDYKKREVIMVGFGISEHREIIDDYAARGYRYVGSIKLKFPFYPSYLTLHFMGL